MPGVVALSGGTDGEDGPTDAAGAVVGTSSWKNDYKLGQGARRFLEQHDAYALFELTGDLLKTGLTGTNVMDVRIIVIR